MVKQVKTIALTSMTLALHNDFHSQVQGFIMKADPEVIHLSAQADRYLEAIRKESSIVQRQTAYVSTVRLKESDQRRDHGLSVVLNLISAHCYNLNTEKRSAALALDAVVAPYRGIRNHEYRTETREIIGLLAALSTDENKEHITTLNMADEVDALDMANSQFDTAISAKQMEEVQRSEQTSVNTLELRAEIDAIYAEMVQIVNAYAVIQSSEALEQFITDVNALITLVKRSMANSGSSTSETEDEENMPPHEGVTEE